MRRLLLISLFSLLGQLGVMAIGWHEVNTDYKTISAMGTAYAEEIGVESQTAEATDSIFRHYTKSTLATAGIYEARKYINDARKDVRLFSNEEFMYYQMAVRLVRDCIMPTLVRVTYNFVQEPEQALFWGPYLYDTTEEVKTLCKEFESVVTNGKLSFKDLVFYEINARFRKYFDLLVRAKELTDTDWKEVLNKLTSFGKDLTWEQIKEDVEKFAANLATAGKATGLAVWDDASQIGDVFNASPGQIITMFNNYKRMYNQLHDATSVKDLILQTIDTHNPGWMSQIFDVSDYNINNYMSSYIQELQGTYTTQTWYIKRKSSGSEVLLDYVPPKGKPNPDPYNMGITYNSMYLTGKDVNINTYKTICSGWDAWLCNEKTVSGNGDANSVVTDGACVNADYSKLCDHVEQITGWTLSKKREYQNSHPGHKLKYVYTPYHYDYVLKLQFLGKRHFDHCYKAYGLKITDTWSEDSIVYEEMYDSQTMDLETFKKKMEIRLNHYIAQGADEKDPDYGKGYTYVLEPGPTRQYTVADKDRLRGVSSVTFIANCANSLSLGEGTIQWKENSKKQKDKITEYSQQLAMESDGSSPKDDINELRQKDTELKAQLASLQEQETKNDQQLTSLRSRIQQARFQGNTALANSLQQQWNDLNDQQSELKAQEQAVTEQINEVESAINEYYEDLLEDADNDKNRIPKVMNTFEAYYGITWGKGSWDDNNVYTCEGYSNTGNFPVKFTAKLTLQRKPKYVLGIRVHRPILQVEYNLTSDKPASSVLESMNLDPSADPKANEEKVNKRLKELLKDYPDCDIKLEYQQSSTVEDEEDEDKIHLLFASDRLEVARQVVDRLANIYASLQMVELRQQYKKTVKQFLRELVCDVKDHAKRGDIAQNVFLEWKRAGKVARDKQDPLHKDSTKVESGGKSSGGS